MGENGTRFIDKLIAASPNERRKFPFLGQDIYFRPLTRAAMVQAMPKDNVERPRDYAGLFMLVASAEAEDGTKLFRLSDVESLRTQVSLDLLQQLEAAMLGTVAPSLEEAAKDLEANPPSAS